MSEKKQPKVLIAVGEGGTTRIKAYVEAIEKAIGEKVEYVCMHAQDKEYLLRKIPERGIVVVSDMEQPTLTQETIELCTKLKERPFVPMKKKGHERPYKYHK